MAQKRQRLVTVITGYEPRRDDQVWPPIACEIAPPHAKLQAIDLGAWFSLPAATADHRADPASERRPAALSAVYPCRPHVEINAGTVTESTEPSCIGQFRFFVSFIDGEGRRLALWDGPTHADAVALASQSARAFAAPVLDRSRSSHK